MPSSRRVSWAKFRVLCVSLVATFIVAILVYLLTGGTLLQQKAKVYLYIPDATGLAPAAAVRVDGVGVGKVDAVELSGANQPDRIIRVTMTLERTKLSAIPVDSFAQLSSEDLAGDKFVDITSGKSPDSVRPDGEIHYKVQADFMKSLDISDFEKQLRAVDAVLSDIEQGKSALGQFVLGDDMYLDVRKKMQALQNGIRTAAATSNAVGEALYSDRLYRQVSGPLAALDKQLAELQSGQGAGGALLRDSAQYDQLRSGAQGLEKTIHDLRASEFMQSDRLYEDWNKQLGGLIQSVQEMNTNPMIASAQTYESLNGFAREMRDTLRDFRKDPRKYLRIKVF